MIFETINQTFQKVIDSLGLNANIFSSEKGATFNNGDAFLKSAYQDCVIPFAEKFCFALTNKLNLVAQGIYIELDYSHLPCMQVNETEIAKEMQMKANALNVLISAGYSIEDAEATLGITKP